MTAWLREIVALNYAVYPAQLINSNPAAYIKVPRNAPRNVVNLSKRGYFFTTLKTESSNHCRADDGRIDRRSKGLPAPDAPKVSLVCTRDNGQLILYSAFIPAYACGAAPKGVVGRLGHANTQITQDLYSHNTRKLQEEPASIFDNFLQTNFYRLYFKRSYIDSFIAERN